MKLSVIMTLAAFMFLNDAASAQTKPVDLSIAAPIMLNRDHNAGCGIEKDSEFKAQLDFFGSASIGSTATPWEAFSFETEPEQYMRAVLDQALQDNDAIDWDIGNNPNGWVHAPWMAQDREPFQGMTRERTSRPFELHPNQDKWHQNYAFGLYNATAADAFARLWENPTSPATESFSMANGSVAVKLLFTTAPESQVPYLANAKVVDFCKGNDTIAKGRLTQLDIAVRDRRADAWTGWVFGTFIYWGEGSTEFSWDNMRPLTLQWGNDPSVWPTAVANPNDVELVDLPELRESWFDGEIQSQIGQWRSQKGLRPWTGLFGRANGPIDNPISSCLSCHNVAADFGRGSHENPAMVVDPPSLTENVLVTGMVPSELQAFFENRKWNEPKLSDTLALDYSLQAMIGVLNFRAWAECRGTPAPHASPVYGAEPPPILDEAACQDVLKETGDLTFTPESNAAATDTFSAFKNTRPSQLLDSLELIGGNQIADPSRRQFR